MSYNSNKTPAELSELSALATNDTIIVGDTSDTSEVVKKITAENLYVDIAAASMTMTNKILTTPTITLKQSASPAPTAEGDIQWDTDNDKLVIGDGATAKTFVSTSAVSGDVTMTTSGVATVAWPSALTVIPIPVGFDGTVIAATAVTGNTNAYVGQVMVPFAITVNKVSFSVNGVSVAGTFIVSLFSEDGQTQLFSVTTASVSGAAIVTTSVSSVPLEPGNYYITIQPTSTANATIHFWQTANAPFGTSVGILSDVSSEPVLRGTVTVTANTAPSTLTPASITDTASGALICRLDN